LTEVKKRCQHLAYVNGTTSTAKQSPYSNITHILCQQRGPAVTGYTRNKPTTSTD